jgi:hypothetical protein
MNWAYLIATKPHGSLLGGFRNLEIQFNVMPLLLWHPFGIPGQRRQAPAEDRSTPQHQNRDAGGLCRHCGAEGTTAVAISATLFL